MNYVFSLVGFIATICVIAGPFVGLGSLLVWIFVKSEKKKKLFKALALSGLIMTVGGGFGIVFVLWLYTTFAGPQV